jgi:hypothetical protein
LELRRVHKKLAEAHYFLRLLRDQEPRIGGDKDPFDFLLSAFLSAGRSVDYRLRHEHKAAYEPWRKRWDARLTPAENGLIKFMIDDRNEEVHDSGSSRSVGQEGVGFGIGIHHTPDGIIIVGGHPITAYRPSYSFDRRRRPQSDRSVRRISSIAATDGGRVSSRCTVKPVLRLFDVGARSTCHRSGLPLLALVLSLLRGTEGSNPSLQRRGCAVRTGDIGNGTYLRHG